MPRQPLAPDAARRLLARAGYGARPGEAEAVARAGASAWVEAQLVLPEADPAVEARLAALRMPIRLPGAEGAPPTEELRPLRTLAASQAERWALLDQLPDRRVPPPERDRVRLELAAATLLRRVAGAAQLRERVVEFWHDHFAVTHLAGPAVLVSLPDHNARLRTHALGSFRALLEAVATSPAMLFTLNNQASRAGAPNENYARELLELHTLGRPAYRGAAASGRDVPRGPDGLATGYVDADVWEAARALTGWSVENGQRVDGGLTLPRSGAFRYVAAWHDNYQKLFLGRALDPFAAAMADGRAVLDTLAAHPATARFVCTKLVRFLVGDPAPAGAVARAEAAFRRHAAAPDQLARVVRAALLGPEVLAPTAGRVRRPTDFVAAAARALDLPFTPTVRLVSEIAAAGQPLFGWPSPDGQPVDAAAYLGAGALRARWTAAQALARDGWGVGASPLLPGLVGRTAEEVAGALAGLLLGEAGAAVVGQVAAAWAGAGRPAHPGPAETAELAGWVLVAPAFQVT